MYNNVHARKLNYWLVCLLWCDNLQALVKIMLFADFNSCMLKNLTMQFSLSLRPALSCKCVSWMFKNDHTSYRIFTTWDQRERYSNIFNVSTLSQNIHKFWGEKIEWKRGEFIEREWKFPERERSFQEISVAYAPQQNGVVKKDNRIMVEIIKCILLCKNSTLIFWVRLLILLSTF
jgi:hypothetical protein